MTTTTHIKFGDGLDVTDEGAGVIRVDGSGGVPGATGPQGPAGPPGPNLIDGSTPTPLTGLLKGNGTDIDVATPAEVLAAAGLGKSAQVQHSTSQPVSHATFTLVTFNTEVFDTDTIYDPAQPTRLTAKTAGIYLIDVAIQFEANATGIRLVQVLANAANVITEDQRPSPGAFNAVMMNLTTIQFLNVNQFVETRVYQDSGGSLNLQNYGSAAPLFSMVRVA